MAYRYGDRRQMQLLPQTIEDYVAQNDPVRAYDAFIEAIKLSELGIVWDDSKVGNSTYDPKAMLKLLLYGYSYGHRSSRKIERATYHNVSFIWLMGGLKPDHKTIALFRDNNRTALKNILKQCARFCIKLNLIEGNTLFLDGTKFRANAGIKHTWTSKQCQRYLKHIDETIESILTECEKTDTEEGGLSSLVAMQDELKDKKALQIKMQQVLQEIKKENRKSINTTDPDCVKTKGRQGIHAGYNGQIVVDKKHGLIVHSDVISESNDKKQFANQINQANETLGQKCETACADAGYANTDELKEIHDQGIAVIVPSQTQAHDREIKPFDKKHFTYDPKSNTYACPEGNKLTYSHHCKDKNHNIYQIKHSSSCIKCQHFGICTKSKYGRRIRRLANEETKQILEQQYTQKSSQAIYKLRKEKVEHPFGHIKRNLGVSGFLLRGIKGVKAEMALFAACFNIVRMTNIIGVKSFVTELSG